jgi:hypothetical protein
MNSLTVWVLVVSVAHPKHVRVEAYATEAACKAEADRVLLVAAQNANAGWQMPMPKPVCERHTVRN